MAKIHSENIKNTNSLFELKDNNGTVISKIIENENSNEIVKKIIIIGTESMYKNIKDNQVNQYFFDCTYKKVPPNKNKHKMMVLC